MLAGWVEAREFSTVRLRPGYDEEEVDDFLNDAELRLARVTDLETGKNPDNSTRQPLTGWKLWWRLCLRVDSGSDLVGYYTEIASGSPILTVGDQVGRQKPSRPRSSMRSGHSCG